MIIFKRNIFSFTEFIVLLIFCFIYSIAPLSRLDGINTHFIVPAIFIFHVFKRNFFKIFSDRAIVYYTIFVLITIFSLINAIDNNAFDYDSYIRARAFPRNS